MITMPLNGWSEFKNTVIVKKNLRIQYAEFADRYDIYASEDGLFMWNVCLLKTDDGVSDFENNYKPMANKPINQRSIRGNVINQTDLRAGNKTQVISQNFCDKNTWYSTSIRRTNQAMTDVGDGYTFMLSDGYKIGVDVTHARILHERRLRSAYKVKAYIDSVEVPEKDPHDNDGYFVVDYDTMNITFDTNQSGKTITCDFSEVQNSKWYLAPLDGKIIRLVKAELQFSRNAKMKDTFVFQPRADVSKFPPLFPYWDENPYGAPGPYPAGTKLPIGDAVYYQSVFDLICEANLAYPTLEKTIGENLGWRDLKDDIVIYSWDYENQATIDLNSAYGMDIEISLEHDTECEGQAAVVTFYCLSEDE